MFSFHISHPCCHWMLLHPSCCHLQQPGRNVQPAVLCSSLPSARGHVEGSAPPGLSCIIYPHPGLGKRLKTSCLGHTTWPSPSMPGTGTLQEAAAVSLPLLPVCSQVGFPSFLWGNRRWWLCCRARVHCRPPKPSSCSAAFSHPPHKQGKTRGNNPMAKLG